MSSSPNSPLYIHLNQYSNFSVAASPIKYNCSHINVFKYTFSITQTFTSVNLHHYYNFNVAAASVFIYTHCFMLEDHLGSVIRLIIIIIVIGSYIYPAIYQTMHHQVVFTLIIHDTFRKYICQVHNTVKGRGPKPLSC